MAGLFLAWAKAQKARSPHSDFDVYRTGGLHCRQPVLNILSHASMALCRSIRLRVIGIGALGGVQR